ncbi:unnamed protein product [Bemisia tabaci]|uniref:C2H2-type domain-containing protein n=1 Tax=Bemisia tabaci TaxID=7038 RepID=A0A9P0A1F1_BEMTA|nr:unnamed protein product [Bemisia tabaci]
MPRNDDETFPREDEEDRPFKCDLCQDKSYKRKAHLWRHQTYECPNVVEKPKFPCSICSFVFKRKAHLQRHLIYQHGVRNAQISSNGSKSP